MTTSRTPIRPAAVPTIVMDVEIRDDDTALASRRTSGEIWMKSPTLIRGYWRKPEATATRS